MAKKKQQRPRPRKYAPDEVNNNGEYIKIDGSPTPGITLKHILQRHTGQIHHLAWSPDGRILASVSQDATIKLWDEFGNLIGTCTGHKLWVTSLAWSPDGKTLVSGSGDTTIRIWDVNTHTEVTQPITIDKNSIHSLAWSSNGKTIAVRSAHSQIYFLDVENNFKLRKQKVPIMDDAPGLVWSVNGRFIYATAEHSMQTQSYEKRIFDVIKIDLQNNKSINLSGHRDKITSLACAPSGEILASGSFDKTVKIWETKDDRLLHTLEGHSNHVHGLSFSSNGKFLATKSCDNTVRIWKCDTWGLVSVIAEKSERPAGFLAASSAIAFNTGNSSVLATLGNEDSIIRIWQVNTDVLLRKGSKSGATEQSIKYTTAKLVLVGDSGVGKTGLGWRLAHNEFKEHSSTHGQQFWVVPELKKTRKDGTECEAVLWDLAGQHIYRSIHTIFLDDVDASLILFDPTNRQEPLKGAQFWLEQLKGKKQLPPSVLVGARLDRGAPVLSQQELEQFCQKYGISGGYIGTSAKSGEGLDTLLENLKAQIPWDQMTTTVTTVTFKRIKEFVLSLKEKPDRKSVLVRPDELRKQLQATDKDWHFSDAEMMTAVGHLANHGYVTILKSSAGEEYILLVPELLSGVASSIFLHADKHPRELGAINETDLLHGKYPIDEFKGLENEEQQVLLDATVVRFLEHSICFRETYGNDSLLIFPSLIKQKRPLKDDIPAKDDISYIVRGRVENIYATLVVLLGYTPSFNRINQWQNQAQYETERSNICGFRLIEDREGEIELILYFGNEMPEDERNDFQALFEQFLYKRDVEVIPFPPVICPNGHRQERAIVVKRSQEGKKSIFCDECGAKTELPIIEEPQTIGTSVSPWLQVEEAIARLRSAYEAHLVRVKGYRRGWETPRCYISHIPEQKDFAQRLSHDLSDAGIYVVEEPSKIIANDVVIVLDSSSYQKAWRNRAKALEKDVNLIQPRLSSKKLISIVIEGKNTDTHDIRGCKPGDFCDTTHYSVSLFDLVLNLFAIPFNHAGFVSLRKSLHEQWERDLAGKKGKEIATALKVFISYSHKDEEFKDELVTMLAGLQRRGIIDAWQDRRIEEGDEWYQDIQDAMNDCDLAILLVSANFIASRFIQDEELPKLLEHHIDEGMRVVPVIVKPCLWQSEPVIKDLQVLPRDGKPVITFSKDNGERDQVWADIAKVIEKRAK